MNVNFLLSTISSRKSLFVVRTRSSEGFYFAAYSWLQMIYWMKISFLNSACLRKCTQSLFDSAPCQEQQLFWWNNGLLSAMTCIVADVSTQDCGEISLGLSPTYEDVSTEFDMDFLIITHQFTVCYFKLFFLSCFSEEWTLNIHFGSVSPPAITQAASAVKEQEEKQKVAGSSFIHPTGSNLFCALSSFVARAP